MRDDFRTELIGKNLVLFLWSLVQYASGIKIASVLKNAIQVSRKIKEFIKKKTKNMNLYYGCQWL